MIQSRKHHGMASLHKSYNDDVTPSNCNCVLCSGLFERYHGSDNVLIEALTAVHSRHRLLNQDNAPAPAPSIRTIKRNLERFQRAFIQRTQISHPPDSTGTEYSRGTFESIAFWKSCITSIYFMTPSSRCILPAVTCTFASHRCDACVAFEQLFVLTFASVAHSSQSRKSRIPTSQCSECASGKAVTLPCSFS